MRMRVIAHDPYLRPGTEKVFRVEMVSLEELLSTSDVVSLHTPLTEQTERLINTDTLAQMKPDSIWLTPRCGWWTAALAEALRAGKIAAAGVDVLPTEPATEDEPLVQLWREAGESNINLILTPHTAFYSGEAMMEIRTKSAAEVARALRGEKLVNCVNGHWLPEEVRGGFDWDIADCLMGYAAVGMDAADLANIVALWMCLVVLLSFHEYATHGWRTSARGRHRADDGAHDDQPDRSHRPDWDRVSSVDDALPQSRFRDIWLGQAGAGEPVKSVNRKRDDILISMAGPAMNLILAIVILAVLRLAIEMPEGISKSAIVAELPRIAFISMFLCLFNLIRFPPLDGSHVMRHVVGMSEETYRNIARFGFIIVFGRDQHPRRNFIHR